MNKDKLKDMLFDMLNEKDTLFSHISLYDETDTIFIKSVEGQIFIVNVSPVTADEALIKLWTRKRPELMFVALGIVYMRDFGIFTEKGANKYLSDILERAEK